MGEKELQPHEQRVVEEQKELDIKFKALGNLLKKGKPDFIDDKNWDLLARQYDAMWIYNDILKERIALFS